MDQNVNIITNNRLVLDFRCPCLSVCLPVDADTQTHRDTDRHVIACTHIHTQVHAHTERYKYRQTDTLI